MRKKSDGLRREVVNLQKRCFKRIVERVETASVDGTLPREPDRVVYGEKSGQKAREAINPADQTVSQHRRLYLASSVEAMRIVTLYAWNRW